MTNDCQKENSTQHYLGSGAGFGPVRNDELLLYAVFDKTPINITTKRLLKEAFRKNQLIRTEISVARRGHISLEEFQARVVLPAVESVGNLVGIARVMASALRGLEYSVSTIPTMTGRAICVLDKVTALDFNAHAALGYSERQATLSEKQRATIRELIRADLADVFGEILSPSDAFAPAAGVHAEQASKQNPTCDKVETKL